MVQLNLKKQGGLIRDCYRLPKVGQVLMLAYMNQDAYEKTLSTRQMHYWSRSRQELWHKGATSGHFQEVVSIKRIVIMILSLVSVRQTVAACHTGAYSCFFNDIL